MLYKYLLPVVALVALQIFLGSWAEAQADGDKEDLDSAELFLRPVVIKHGQDHPGVYTWQGGSGVGQGWGVYKPQAPVMMQPAGGGGWGQKEKKKKKAKKSKKKKKKKEKKKKEKKKKEKKKKEKKKKEKKKKEKKGGWGWSWGWIEEGGGQGGSENSSGGGGGGGGGDGEDAKRVDDDDENEKGRFDPVIRPQSPPVSVARFGGPARFIEDYDDYEPFNSRHFPNTYNNY